MLDASILTEVAKQRILVVIVVAQFCCTSLWFAGNGVMSELVLVFGLKSSALGHLTSSVQLGFILGTLIFAIFTIADRFSPSKVFMISALLGALFNLGTILPNNSLLTLLSFRFLTGFFLAGIYPVGMKIAADYFSKGLGKSLGLLVGALVLGTALPHLLNGISFKLAWESVILGTSILAVFGGLLLFFLVPDGPDRRRSSSIDLSAFSAVFKNKEFRSAAFGYFGHMWELYAFWAFVPFMLQYFNEVNTTAHINISIMSFVIIGLGGLACVVGGVIGERVGSKRTAFFALLLSCLCCLVSPFLLGVPNQTVFLAFLIFWGMAVIADSPLFSTLVAHNAQQEIKGTALTIVNSIGFAITIISIQLLNYLQNQLEPKFLFLILAAGPILGLIALRSSDINDKRIQDS